MSQLCGKRSVTLFAFASLAVLVEGHFSPSTDFAVVADSEPSTANLHKSAENILNGIRSIFSGKDEESCIGYDRECSLESGEAGCCSSLSCLYDMREALHLCQCRPGSFANNDGTCIYPEYPSLLSSAVWIALAAVVTLSFSYLLISMFRNKRRPPNATTNDMGYSTFGEPSSGELHHITSVLSPVVASQMVQRDQPPVYQMEEMPPPYHHVVDCKPK